MSEESPPLYAPPPIRYRKPREAPLFLFIVLSALAIGGCLYAVTLWQQRERAHHLNVLLTWFDAAPRLRADGQSAWRPAFRGMPIAEGTDLRTRRGGRTVLSVEGVSSLRLGPFTSVRFESLYRDGNTFHLRIRLLVGRLWLDCARSTRVVVDTDAGHFKNRGSATELIVTRDDSTLRAWRGKAWYGGSLSTKPVTLPARHELILPLDSRAIARAIPPEDEDIWDRWNLHTSAAEIADGTVEPERKFVVLAARPLPPRFRRRPVVPRFRRTAPRAPREVASIPFSRQLGTAPPGSGYVNLPSYVPDASMARGASNWQDVTPHRPRPQAPPRVAAPAEPAAPHHAAPSPGWLPPSDLTHRGLPDLAYAVNMGLPRVDTRSPDDAQSAFHSVALLLSQKFDMRLRRPAIFKLVSSDDFSVLKTHMGTYAYYYETALGKSYANYHELWIIEGLDQEEFLTTSAEFLGDFWYDENRAAGGGSQSEMTGFGIWISYKYLIMAGGAERARAFLAPNVDIDGNAVRTEDFHQILSLEKDYGEYGVLYYVTHGVPPEYVP